MSTWRENLGSRLGLSPSAQRLMPSIITVFVLALVVRIAVLILFIQTDPGFIIDNDSVGYISLAENLEAGNGFAWDTGMPFTPDSFRTPAYPVFLYLHHLIFGSFIPALLTQILLSLFIALVVLKLADRYLTPKMGVVAAGVFLFMPFSILVTDRYLTQILYTAVVMGAVWYYLAYLEQSKTKHLVMTALFIPLSAYVRPISIFFTAPFIASGVLAWLWKRMPLTRLAMTTLVIVGCFVLAIAPWIYRNYTVFGLSYFSSITAVQLYFYDAPAIYATAQDIPYEEARTILNTHIAHVTGYTVAENPVLYTELSELTPVLKKEGLEFALANPFALVETRAIQFFKFFTRDGIRYWIEHYGVDTYHGWSLIPIILERVILLGFTIGFFWYAVRAFLKKNLAVTTMALVVLYFAVLSGVMSSAGLRFPAEPLFLLIGTAGLFALYTEVRNRLKVKLDVP